MTPTLLVVMCAYNEESHIRASIDSVIRNTFENFKLIVIDDGSTDLTPQILNEFYKNDSRITVIRNTENVGIAMSTNIALRNCNTDFVAIMDADDVSLPERFEVQINYLRSHPEIDVVGSSMFTMSGIENNEVRAARHHDLRNSLLKENIVFNPTVMFRGGIVEKGLFYCNPRFRYTHDYQIWTRLAVTCKFANIEQPLVIYRDNKSAGDSNSSSNPFRREVEVVALRTLLLLRLITSGNFEIVQIRYYFASLVKGSTPAFLGIFKQWLRRIKL